MAGLNLGANILNYNKPKPPRVDPSLGQAGGAAIPKPPKPAAPKPPSFLPGGPPIGSTITNPLAGAPGSPIPAPSAPAAPASPPPGSPPYNIGTVPADELAKGAAQGTYDSSTSGYMAAIQAAAQAYGDPGVMAQWGLGSTVNPNSALALAALKAQQDTQTAGNTREQAGTYFSSLHDQDLSDIAGAQSRSDLAGYQTYQGALGDYGRNMTDALNTLNNSINSANLDERQNAINNLPTPSTASGGFQGGSTSVTSKVPTTAQKASNAASKLKSTQTTASKTKSKLPSVGSPGKVVSNAAKNVTGVKKVGKAGKR